MGRLCRIYSLYYFILFVVFVMIGLIGIVLLAGVASDCAAICPLETKPSPDAGNAIPGEACTGQQGYCLDTDNCRAKADILALSPEEANGQGCFICEGSAVYWPAYRSTGVEKWQPTGACTEVTSGGDKNDGYLMCWSVPSEVSLRGLATPSLWLLTITHLIQAVGCLVCGIGMKHFAQKYSDDWKKLTDREMYLGIAVKLFPKVNRVLNIVTVTFIFVGLFMFIGEEAENTFGKVEFYPQATTFVTVSLIGFILTCIGGTTFRRVQPFETPFYQPRMRPDEDANAFVRKCWEPSCYYFSMLGP